MIIRITASQWVSLAFVIWGGLAMLVGSWTGEKGTPIYRLGSAIVMLVIVLHVIFR